MTTFSPDSVVDDFVTGIYRCPPFCQSVCVEISKSADWRTPDHWDAGGLAGDEHPYNCTAGA